MLTNPLTLAATPGGEYGFIWIIVGVLAIIALFMYILRGRG